MNLKIGDKVKVIKKIISDSPCWTNEMDETIGKEYTIKCFSKGFPGLGNCGFNETNWYYLIQSLEKVENLIPIKKVTIKIGSETVEVSETIANILKVNNEI